jgi:hypothetical protein
MRYHQDISQQDGLLMGNLIGHRIIPILIGAAVVSCSGELTLPSDGERLALEVVSGDGQEGTVGSRLDPLVVRVVDGRAEPVAGVVVVFQFESAAPEAEVSPEAETTEEGLASAEVRLGTSAGTHIVEARVADASGGALRATFDLNALERGKKGKDRHDDDEEDDD